MTDDENGQEQVAVENEKSMLARLESKLDQLGVSWEQARVSEYVDMMQRPGRLLYINFIMGVSRGFGMAVGFTILTALVLWILQKLVLLNLPFLSNIIADLVKMVKAQLVVSQSVSNF
ncbi:MAG: DUF5665 domain-containing protein [Methylocystaceae bacterium]